MGFEFLSRIRRTSIVLGVLLAPVLATYLGVNFGGAWLAGIAWSLINIYFITGLVKHMLTKQNKNYAGASLLLAVKFPVLYTVGFMLLKSGIFPVAGLLAGFVWPFFVTTMKAAGRAFLRLDEVGVVEFEKDSRVSFKTRSWT